LTSDNNITKFSQPVKKKPVHDHLKCHHSIIFN